VRCVAVALEVFKLYMRILWGLQISFMGPVVDQPIRDELRGEFTSFEVDTC
jgi:hypothetical protein